MPGPEIPEGIVSLTHTLVEDASLRSWFLALDRLSKSARFTAFSRMAAKMRDGNEDAALVQAVQALAEPGVYRAVRDAVRERCGL